MLLSDRGDFLLAVGCLEQALHNSVEISDRWTACLIIATIGRVHECLREVQQAESFYRKAIGYGRRLGIPSYLSGMLIDLARLLLEQNRYAEARPFYDEALEMISNLEGERLAGEDTRFNSRECWESACIMPSVS